MPEKRNHWAPPKTDGQYPFLLLTSLFFILGLILVTIAFHTDEPVLFGIPLTAILVSAIIITMILMSYMLIKWNITYEIKLRNHFNSWAKTKYNMDPADANIFEKLQNGEKVYVDGQQIMLVETSFDNFILMNFSTNEELTIRK